MNNSNDDQVIIDKGKNVINIEMEALDKVKGNVDSSFVKAVKMILKCRGKVILTGTGKSGLIARKIAATLSCCDIPSFFLNAYECENGDLGVVRKHDVIVAISNSGETGVLTKLVIPSCKQIGCEVIALTGNLESTLADQSDVSIDIKVDREAGYLGINASSSTTATLAMGDALALVAMELKGTTREKTLFLHQGGAWGEALKKEFQK